MRFFVFPKGTPGKLVKLAADGRPLKKQVGAFVLRKEVSTSELVFDPVRWHNTKDGDKERIEAGMPLYMPVWQQAYASVGFCGIERTSPSGDRFVFITRYSNAQAL